MIDLLRMMSLNHSYSILTRLFCFVFCFLHYSHHTSAPSVGLVEFNTVDNACFFAALDKHSF